MKFGSKSLQLSVFSHLSLDQYGGDATYGYSKYIRRNESILIRQTFC